MYVYLDIETIPSQRNESKARAAARVSHPGSMSKPDTIAKWNAEKRPHAEDQEWQKSALDGGWGELCCICWAIDDGPIQQAERPSIGDSEADMLAAFFDQVAASRASSGGRDLVYVGHNVTGFDLRFLWQRAVVLGVRPRMPLHHDAKPWSSQVIDTMVEWHPRNYAKLTDLCEALRIDVGHEDTITGADVWDCYRRGDFATILVHCRADVERVRAVHRAMTFAAVREKELGPEGEHPF